SMSASKTPLLTKAVIALFLALLVFARQIGFFLVEENRYFYLWQWQDGLALLADVLLLAAMLLAGSVAVGALKWDRVQRVFDHHFLLALVAAALTLLPNEVLAAYTGTSFKANLVWLVIVFAIGFSLGYPRSRLVEFGKGACLVFSPLILILA